MIKNPKPFDKRVHKYSCTQCFDSCFAFDVDGDSRLLVEICYHCFKQKHQSLGLSLEEGHTISKEVTAFKINIESEQSIQHAFYSRRSKYPSCFINGIYEFKRKWPSIKKDRMALQKMNSPDDYKIKKINDDHFTAMYLFIRNPVFQIISKNTRNKFTTKNNFGSYVDIPVHRSFLSWEKSVVFDISGPILCSYDESVFFALIKLWHKKSPNGIKITTNFSELHREMGNTSNASSYAIGYIKRSLIRLMDVSIKVTAVKDKNFWGGGIIDSVFFLNENADKNKTSAIEVHFNKYIVYHYIKGAYSIVSHPVYSDLSSYGKKMYLFLMSHKDPEKSISLNTWREQIGVGDSIENKEFKRKVKIVLDELKNKGILDNTSQIKDSGNVFTKLNSDVHNSYIGIN